MRAFLSHRGDRLRSSRGSASRTGYRPVPGALRARGQTPSHEHPSGSSACQGRPEQSAGPSRIAAQVFRYCSQTEETVSRRALYIYCLALLRVTARKRVTTVRWTIFRN